MTLSEEPNQIKSAMDEVQQRLQDTSATDLNNSSSESDGNVSEPEKAHIPRVTCSGEGGCGNDFPCDEHGSDFQFAMLCSKCYKKEMDDEDTFQQKSPSPSPPPVKKTCEPEGLSDEAVVATKSRGDKTEDNDLMCDGNDGGMDDATYDGSGECGLEMGVVLRNARDIDLKQYDVLAGTKELVFEPYINDQDNISKKIRKFWNIIPNNTPTLYGFKNYQAILNTRSKRGWIGHCRLSTSLTGANGNGYVLWEIWETRCNSPRYDGVVINEKGEVMLIQHIEKWLNDNALSSDLSLDYDHEWYER